MKKARKTKLNRYAIEVWQDSQQWTVSLGDMKLRGGPFARRMLVRSYNHKRSALRAARKLVKALDLHPLVIHL
jgi:hypothetical protein